MAQPNTDFEKGESLITDIKIYYLWHITVLILRKRRKWIAYPRNVALHNNISKKMEEL